MRRLIKPSWIVVPLLLAVGASLFKSVASKTCIESKVGHPCYIDADCTYYGELHLYCNTTAFAYVCAYQIETYISQAKEDSDCPGEEYSAEQWSNPVSDDVINNSTGVDCIRLCLFTQTCFGAVVKDHHCFLKNDKCFTNIQHSPGAVLGVMSVVREDYHCGCHYPFTRKRKDGQVLLWTPQCPENQLDRNPYRCCSPKGLCTLCEYEHDEALIQDDKVKE